MNKNELLILKDHTSYVEGHGTFPLRHDFQVRHRARIKAFDSLEGNGCLAKHGQYSLWTLRGLRAVAGDVPFAARSLERCRQLLEILQDMFAVEGAAQHSIEKIAKKLDGAELDEVRRLLILLQRTAAFHFFGILVEDAADEVGMTDEVLRLDSQALFSFTDEQQTKTKDAVVDPKNVKKLAYSLFKANFADGNTDINVIPETPEERAAFRELARHGLVNESVHGGAFLLGPRGIEVWMGEANLRQVLGIQDDEPSAKAPPGPVRDRKKVFIIHGRNTDARDEMESFLRACGLDPINFDDLAAREGQQTIIKIVEAGMNLAQGIVALITPDEFSVLEKEHEHDHDKPEDRCRHQARPNVIFEVGMAFGKDADRVVLVLLGNPSLFTDVSGIHVLRPTNEVHGHRRILREKLKNMGCDVSESSAWMKAGDFERCVQPRTVPEVASEGRAPPGMSKEAEDYMRKLGRAYVEGEFPNHKVWQFDKGADTVIHSELRNALGFIKLMGTRGSAYVLTARGHAWIMQHRDELAAV